MFDVRTTTVLCLTCLLLAGCNAFGTAPSSLEYKEDEEGSSSTDVEASDMVGDVEAGDALASRNDVAPGDAASDVSGNGADSRGDINPFDVSDIQADTPRLKSCKSLMTCRRDCKESGECTEGACLGRATPQSIERYWLYQMCLYQECDGGASCAEDECRPEFQLCSSGEDYETPSGSSLDTCVGVIKCQKDECKDNETCTTCIAKAEEKAFNKYKGLATCYNQCAYSLNTRLTRRICALERCAESFQDRCFQDEVGNANEPETCGELRKCFDDCPDAKGYACLSRCYFQASDRAWSDYKEFVQCYLKKGCNEKENVPRRKACALTNCIQESTTCKN